MHGPWGEKTRTEDTCVYSTLGRRFCSCWWAWIAEGGVCDTGGEIKPLVHVEVWIVGWGFLLLFLNMNYMCVCVWLYISTRPMGLGFWFWLWFPETRAGGNTEATPNRISSTPLCVICVPSHPGGIFSLIPGRGVGGNSHIGHGEAVVSPGPRRGESPVVGGLDKRSRLQSLSPFGRWLGVVDCGWTRRGGAVAISIKMQKIMRCHSVGGIRAPDMGSWDWDTAIPGLEDILWSKARVVVVVV